MRAEGEVTRGTTNPSRLRRVDRWISGTQRAVLLAAERPLVVDLGYGASPVTTVELYRAVRKIAPDAEVTGLEIDPDRVAAAGRYLDRYTLPGLSFARGGFELPVPKRPVLVRSFNVLRQYSEERAWAAWARLRDGLADGGVLVEGTCDELGRRAVWVTLPRTGDAMITFSARLASLDQPSDLAERLPKVLIHRNVPGEQVFRFLRDFDHAWACAAPQSVFGLRQRWLTTVAALADEWPVIRHPPYGGQVRWRLGELTLPWAALAPAGIGLPAPARAWRAGGARRGPQSPTPRLRPVVSRRAWSPLGRGGASLASHPGDVHPSVLPPAARDEALITGTPGNHGSSSTI